MTSIKMPQLGETIVEGTILKWLKAEGEAVELDEPLFEISTDKVDTEVPSPVAGTLTKILVEEGATVSVGTELAVIESDEDSAVGLRQMRLRHRPRRRPRWRAAGRSRRDAGPGLRACLRPTRLRASSPAAVARRAGSGASVADPVAARAEVGAGARDRPVHGRRHRDRGADHESDVMAAVASGAGPVPAAVAPAAPRSGGRPRPCGRRRPRARRVEPMSHIRKADREAHDGVGQRDGARVDEVEVNVEHLVRLRERAKDAFLAAHGVKLTYMPFVMRATVEALARSRW